jgi:hypothetical protein
MKGAGCGMEFRGIDAMAGWGGRQAERRDEYEKLAREMLDQVCASVCLFAYENLNLDVDQGGLQPVHFRI